MYGWNKLTDEQKLFYFGGLIDGEGYIGLAKHGGGKRPVIQLQMTCESTVSKFAEHFGLVVRLLQSPSRLEKKHWKPIYHTRAECLKALPILKTLKDYVFLKKPALEEALKYYEGRECKVCSKPIESTKNSRTLYCSAACRQKQKRK